MTKLTIAVVFLVAAGAVAGTAFSKSNWELKPGMGYVYGGPGNMSAIPMASGEKNHAAMMRNATRVPNNTVFFMQEGQLYSTSGMLDPTGNFYIP